MTVTRGKTIPYINDTITKEVLANVNTTSFGVQFIRMSAGWRKYTLKANILLQFTFTSPNKILYVNMRSKRKRRSSRLSSFKNLILSVNGSQSF